MQKRRVFNKMVLGDFFVGNKIKLNFLAVLAFEPSLLYLIGGCYTIWAIAPDQFPLVMF
jgi:hypothetical protein